MTNDREKLTEEQEKQIIIDKLVAEHDIEKLIQFTDINIQEKIRENALMIVKYRDLYHAELGQLEVLEDKLEALKGKRYHHYRFEYEKELTKVEIERYYLPQDPFILKMNKLIRRQKVKVRFFEMCYKAFEKQQWNLKLFWETIKF